MRFSIERLFTGCNLDNIKVVRRVIVSVVGSTVLLIGIVLLVLPGPALVIIPVGMAILATEYAWARRWLVSLGNRGEYEERAVQLAEDKAHKPDERLLIDPIRQTSGFFHAGKAGACYRRFKAIETAIDNRYRNALIRQRIPMSTAPLVCQICKK